MTLKEWLSQSDKTLADNAKRLGMKQSFLSLIASGQRKLPIKRLKKFEQVTGITRQELRPELYK